MVDVFPATLRVAQSPGDSPPVRGSQVTSTEAKMKARIIEYHTKKRPLTIKLKSGAVHWVPDKSRFFTADNNVKFSGTVLASDDDSFIFGAYEGFLGHYYEAIYTYRISYSDIKSLRVNIVPDGMKLTGEIAFCLFIWWPTGACSP